MAAVAFPFLAGLGGGVLDGGDGLTSVDTNARLEVLANHVSVDATGSLAALGTRQGLCIVDLQVPTYT